MIFGEQRIPLERPELGYGGHEVVVSEDRRFAALYMYSGQNDEGWELFRLSPSLEHIGSVPYFFGLSEGVLFSPDGRFVVCASAGEMNYTAPDGTVLAEAETDPDVRVSSAWVLECAQLHVQELETRAVRCIPICVRLPAGYEEEPLDWEPPTELRFKPDGSLSFLAGWGKRVKIRMPPRARILFPSP
jgi:hypothetical protein